MKKEIKEIIGSHINDTDIPENVRIAFEMWLAEDADRRDKEVALSEIWDNIPLTAACAPEDPSNILGEAEKIESIQSQKVLRRKSVWMWVMTSVAACMTLFAVIVWSQSYKSETCLASSSTTKGEFILPDGSRVWLNKGSRMYYSNGLKGKTRLVRLEGEAYFDVAKDSEHPFVVKAGDMSIRVLGTRFTVSAYDEKSSVAYLEEGRIMASVKGHDPVMLSPDHAVAYDAGERTFVVFKENVSDHTAWIDGRLEFVNKSLSDIIDCLEHWYCIDISCNDKDVISDIRLSMTIRQESVEDIFGVISEITGLSCFIDSRGNVKISGE